MKRLFCCKCIIVNNFAPRKDESKGLKRIILHVTFTKTILFFINFIKTQNVKHNNDKTFFAL